MKRDFITGSLTRTVNIFCILLLLSTVGLTTACRKHSSALPPRNDTSSKDSVNIIDTPTVSNSLYDSANVVFSRSMEVYRDNVSITKIQRITVGGAQLDHNDGSVVIRVNGFKLSPLPPYQWWQYSTSFDSSSTPGYPVYDSAWIQFIAPNGFKDLDFKMPYLPFYAEPIPYILPKDNGFTISVVANKLGGADSLYIDIVGGNYDTTLKITDCSINIDSAKMHQVFSSFPQDGQINFATTKYYNVSSHDKKYRILNQCIASYHFLAQ